jgi:RimJ/RimL family protein N-acetyltransferase
VRARETGLPGRVRVRLRTTQPSDLEFVRRTETEPENAPFIGRWTADRHREVMADPDWTHRIIESADGKPVGLLIAAGLKRGDGAIYIQRIAMSERDRGYGRAALQAFRELVFQRSDVRRLWLRVYENNFRARHLYASLGFAEEARITASSDPDGPPRIVMAIERP